MSLLSLLKSDKFNVFFSVLLGIGIVCIIKPACTGSDCNIEKPPVSSDFDKYVYKLGRKCYEFKPEITECPTSGTIEAFKECKVSDETEEGYVGDAFKRRRTVINRCE
jgi:hypothetical protein